MSGALLVLLLSVGAEAAPRAILGPDGPLWLGPLPPGEPLVALVDPWSGQLVVEGLPEEESTDTVIVRGEDGQITAISRADGTWILVRRDDQGHVSAIEGPGRSRWRFTWGDALTVLDPLGRSTRVTRAPLAEGGELLAVEDAAGRTARTWYAEDGQRVLAWEDPRGLRTTVRQDGAITRLEDPAGRAWTLSRDAEGRVLDAELPSGGLWRWERDEQGRVVRVSDPAGRLTRWDRDEQGRVAAVVRGGQPWRLDRDEQGRIVAIEDPVGGRLQLRRDEAGRVTNLVDAGGDELRLGRGAGTWPTSLTERTGGRWELSFDLLGRPSGVVDPTGRRVVLERDSAGHLSAVRDDRGRLIRLRWSSAGLLTRVEDARGRAVSLLHDALGRLSTLRWGEGAELGLSRDMLGEITELRFAGQRVTIGRDALGMPVSAGDVRWSRDGGSRVSRLDAPGLHLRLEREASGLLRKLTAEGWSLEIGRDALGRPIRYSGTDGLVELTRDPAGRVRAAKDGAELRLERDARGQVTRLEAGELEWRWLRDAAGRPLRVTGPRGLSLGVDWDEAGRLSLLRGPSAALARWVRDGEAALESWTEAGGKELHPGEPRCDGDWLPDGEDAWRWESAEGCAPPLQPWELRGDRLALSRAEDGSVARIVGPEGSVSLARDALGRLSAVVPDDGRAPWRFGYDPLGRLARVQTPAGEIVPLLWSPDGEIWPGGGDPARGASTAVLLSTGEGSRRAWMSGPDGLVGAAEPAWTATLLPDGVGSPVWVQLGDHPAELVHTSMNGLPDSAAAGIAGARGALQAWAGGPLFSSPSRGSWSGPGEVAVDPLSGLRLDGRGRWPWGETAEPTRLDPEVWAPQSPWHQPLALLTALGALPALDDGSWVMIEPAQPALRWLPASLDRAAPPLGPDPGALPLEDDPLTNAIIVELLRGRAGIDAGLPLRVAVEDGFDSPWLPPGIMLPRLTD